MVGKHNILITTCLSFAVIAGAVKSGAANAASDPRFFGTYCGSHRENVTVPVLAWVLPPIWVDRTHHVDFSVEAHADYRETHRGNGLVNGGGRAEVTGHDLPGSLADDYGVSVGDRIPFVFSGRVAARGELKGSALAPGREPTQGGATLSADGVELELRGLDRVLTVRKDRCDNTPPTARIELPREATIPWRQLTTFTATYSDREDASIPDERLVWTSSLDGRLGNGRSIWKNNLSPGRHTITFTATDSGGLNASDTRVLTILNNSPVATIDEPDAGASYTEGVPITFRGRAYDRETGNLTGGSLVWTYAGGFLGTGTEFQAALPAGSHTIHLTATDGELSGRNEVSIRVLRWAGGNRRPGVTITAPPDLSAPVGDVPGSCITLSASSEDPEDGPLTGDALIWTDQPDGHSARTLPQRGETIEACNFLQTGGDLWHTIKIRATDSHGATATDSIRILVIGGGLI